jgi:hypothetical protein
MRRSLRVVVPLCLTLMIAGLGAGAARAQEPPHAWLFGSWSGGLFPASPHISTEACLAQPVVIFTRDVVLRATLTETIFTQRVIETARTVPGRTEFIFAPARPPEANGLLGVTSAPPQPGFGCETPDVLHVQRRSDTEISFPGCADFPYPLVRCGAR